MNKVMIDLETLDTQATAAIVSIGAVRVDPDGVQPETFYRAVIWDAAPLRSVSRRCLAEFWLKQPAEVQAALGDTGAVHLRVALQDLARFIHDGGKHLDGGEIWAGPATFDIAILEHAYNQMELPVPWAHYETRCFSTLRKALPHIIWERSGLAHNALDDARSQALHLVNLLKAVSGAQ